MTNTQQKIKDCLDLTQNILNDMLYRGTANYNAKDTADIFHTLTYCHDRLAECYTECLFDTKKQEETQAETENREETAETQETDTKFVLSEKPENSPEAKDGYPMFREWLANNGLSRNSLANVINLFGKPESKNHKWAISKWTAYQNWIKENQENMK